MATRDKPYATELSAFMSDFQKKEGRRPGATEVHAWWQTAKKASGVTAKVPMPAKLPIGEKRTPTPKGMAKGGVVVSQSDIDSLIREGVGDLSA